MSAADGSVADGGVVEMTPVSGAEGEGAAAGEGTFVSSVRSSHPTNIAPPITAARIHFDLRINDSFQEKWQTAKNTRLLQ